MLAEFVVQILVYIKIGFFRLVINRCDERDEVKFPIGVCLGK